VKGALYVVDEDDDDPETFKISWKPFLPLKVLSVVHNLIDTVPFDPGGIIECPNIRGQFTSLFSYRRNIIPRNFSVGNKPTESLIEHLKIFLREPRIQCLIPYLYKEIVLQRMSIFIQKPLLNRRKIPGVFHQSRKAQVTSTLPKL
jgi:hypothetical protein